MQALRTAMDNNRLSEVEQAMRQLRTSTLAADTVALLIENLRSPDRNRRFLAAWALGMMGSEGKDAIPLMVMLSRDPDRQLRFVAVSALGSIGKGSQKAES